MTASKKTGSLAIALATLLTTAVSYAAPHPAGGRTDFSSRPGIERPATVKYKTGRIGPADTAAIYRHDGRKVIHGRQG
jgi:hypothetical protein